MGGEKWLTAATTIFGIVAAVIYGFERFSYERFYDQFGITPEDVGVNATQVIAQTAFGLATFAFFTALYLFLVLSFVGLYWTFFWAFLNRSPGKTFWDIVKGSRIFRPKWVGVILGALIVVGLLIPMILYAGWADDAGKCAAQSNGRPIRSLHTWLPLVGEIKGPAVHAEKATLRWIDAPPSGLRRKAEVVYLGENGGQTIVYGPISHKVLRVPSSSIALLIDEKQKEYNVFLGCRRPHGAGT